MSPNTIIESENTDEIKNDYRISVIIPAYNSAKFIGETLKTIFSQTIGDFEIIVVDDGSEDDTYSVVNEIFHGVTRTDIQMKLLKQEHSGVSAARNLGMKNAGGEYVMFFDSDDLMNVDCIEKFLIPQSEEKYETIVCGVDLVYENGKTILKYNDKYTYFQNGLDGNEVLKLFLLRKIHICVENIIHRKTFLIAKNIIFTTGSPRGEDVEFNAKALYFSKCVACIPESLVKYMSREKSVSKNISHIFEFTASIKRLRTFLIGKHASEELIRLIDSKTMPEGYQNIIHIVLNAGFTISEISKTADKEDMQLLKKYNTGSVRRRLVYYLFLHTPELLNVLIKIERKVMLAPG
jgi:glycosyltransferase involved in cell wall biosynthesis